MRKWIATASALALVIGFGLSAPGPAWAAPVLGEPVIAIGDPSASIDENPGNPVSTENSAYYNSDTGEIKFFIPLSLKYSGVYGVTSVPTDGPPYDGTAGTIADYGGGMGICDSCTTALFMYLKFTPVDTDPDTAELIFAFTDLDLDGVNDPYHFFEAVQFYDPIGQPISDLIRFDEQPDDSSPFEYTVTGDYDAQTIIFPDISSIVKDDPFYAELRFQSDYLLKKGTNTAEFLIATLETTVDTTEIPVPEPASLLLLGSGLVGLGLVRRRKRA